MTLTRLVRRAAFVIAACFIGGGASAASLFKSITLPKAARTPELLAAPSAVIVDVETVLGMLRREPDVGGFNFWVGYKDSGKSGLDLISGFLSAPEYRNRFLP